MARKISEKDQFINIPKREYLELIKSSLTLEALVQAGLKELDIYKGISSIIDNGRVEIHLQEIKKRYR